MSSSTKGALLIALGAALWATDGLFRGPSLHSIDAVFLAFLEYSLILAALLIWVTLKHGKAAFSLKPLHWMGVAFLGAGGAALATVLFTASFSYIDPSIIILVQKLQPILVILLATIFLKERPCKDFLAWAAVALAAGIVLSFPELSFSFLNRPIDIHNKGLAYAMTATVIWALSTVIGKKLIESTSVDVLAFWRFAMGWLGLGIILLLRPQPLDIGLVFHADALKPIAAMALVSGGSGIIFYYAGLKRTSASIASITELVFSISAIAIHTYFLDNPISAVQAAAATALIFSVIQVASTQSA